VFFTLSPEDLDSMIASALAEYDDDIRAAWTRIRIQPESGSAAASRLNRRLHFK
jgi:hypothetical protein